MLHRRKLLAAGAGVFLAPRLMWGADEALASRKRKAIRRERREALDSGITIHPLTGRDLTEAVWDDFFAFYMDTGSRKWGRPYLTRAFFSLIGESMADRILLVMARRNGRNIAGAINFIGADVTTFKDNTAEFAAAEQGRVSVILEDDTKFAAYKEQNDSTNLVALDIDAPEVLVSEYGYSYARYGLRQSDCTLNFAYSRALAEMRANGQIGDILEQFGLPRSNVYLPGVS